MFSKTEKILLSFDTLLFVKAIGSSYNATYISMTNPALIHTYVNIFQVASIFFLLSLLLIVASTFIQKKNEKFLDGIAILLVVIGTTYIYVAPLVHN